MKNLFIFLTAFIITGVVTRCTDPTDPKDHIDQQYEKIAQIQDVLLNNTPNSGNPEIREQAILELDEILKDESSRGSLHVFNFYKSMMDKVDAEMNDEVIEGIRIWMMYNHGFIVKTPVHVFAFDLVDGYSGWQSSRSYQLPDQLINEIEVLFVSHEHMDHQV